MEFLKDLLIMKPKLIQKAGPLKLYKVFEFPNADPELLYLICSGFTMTGAYLLSKSIFVINDIFWSSYFIKAMHLMPIEIISNLPKNNYFLTNNGRSKELQKLEILHATPILFRRINPEKIINIIINCIAISFGSYPQELITEAFIILRETLYEGMVAHENNTTGKCYKNEKKYNASVLMMFCEVCGHYMCLVCGSSHSEIINHHMQYVKSKYPCHKNTDNLELCKELYQIGENSFKFFDSLGNENENNEFSSGTCKEEICII